MILSDIPVAELAAALTQGGVRLKVGPFATSIEGDENFLPAVLHFLYGDFPLLPNGEIAEFRVRLQRPGNTRRWFRPQVVFLIDDHMPFQPFPRRYGMAAFEWGFNSVVYDYTNEYLIVHAGVVERDGQALIMAAMPGSGKSTLCTILAHRGWRLLSDEFALVRKSDGRVVPIPRPIGLKGPSVELVTKLMPEVQLGPIYRGTHKGDVAHVRPPREAVRRASETAAPRWFLFPHFTPGAATTLTPRTKAQTFVEASDNCFNYDLLGEEGFSVLAGAVDRADGFDLVFSDLQEAVRVIETLTARGHAA